MKKNVLLFFIFLGIDLIFYWNLWNTYFQQDEWFLFGRAIYQSQHLPWSFFAFASKHFWPLGNIVWFFLFNTVRFNASWYAFLAIILHVIASLFLFYFFKNLIKQDIPAFILTIFFVISFTARQVIIWFVVSPFLIPCLIGILLFLILLQKFLKTGKINFLQNVILFGTFLFTFGFREESMLLFVMAPVYLFLFSPKEKRLAILKNILPLMIFMVITIALRFILDHFYGDNVTLEADNPIKIILYNLFSIPPKLIVQNVIELEDIWPIATIYTKLGFPWLVPDGITIIKTVFEDVVFYASIPIAFIIGFTVAKSNAHMRKVFAFGFIWLIVCSVLLAAGGRRLQFLESRYLYVSSIGVLLIFYVVFITVWNIKGRISPFIRVSIILTLSALVIYSFIGIQSRIEGFYAPLSKQREDIIHQLLILYPTIQNRVIFYATCKDMADCKQNPLVLPFQSGVGQMLMVIYGSRSQAAYAPFFKDFYLWDWESQGYKEVNGYGFGYFRDYTKLQEVIVKQKVPLSHLYAFSYDKSNNKIIDISTKIRNNLKSSAH